MFCFFFLQKKIFFIMGGGGGGGGGGVNIKLGRVRSVHRSWISFCNMNHTKTTNLDYRPNTSILTTNFHDIFHT